MRTALQIATVLLTAVTIWLLFTLITAFDRARQANMLLVGKLQESAKHPAAAAMFPGTGDFANREYFATDAPDGGTLTTAIASDPPGLNPLLSNEAAAQDIIGLCTLTLAERDWQKQERYRPLLAEKWEISPDRKTFHITIRKGVYWHGFTDPVTKVRHPRKEVTAHDLKFTWDVIRDTAVNCAAIRAYYQDISEVKVLNDYELTVTWKTEYYGSISSTLGLFPMPRHFYAPDGKFDGRKFNDDHLRNRMIVGCGAYIFRSWKSGREIVLERNPEYIGFRYAAAPPVDKRIFKIIKLPQTRFQAMLAGEINMLGLTPEQWEKRTGGKEFTSGKLRKLRYPDFSSYSYIGYNHLKPCFADAKTRRALTMLINRQKILDQLIFSLGQISKGPLMPDSVYSDKNLQPHPYDPQAAKKLLAEAGWRDTDGDGILERNGEKFTFNMLQISGSSTQQRILLLVQSDLAAAGIDMKLQTVEWSVLLERLKKKDFEACCLGWRNGIDPDLYQIFHSSQSAGEGDNFISFKNERLDQLIMDLRREFDMDKRIAISREIEKIIHDEQPYTFLFCNDALVALDRKFGNVRVFPNSLHSISFFCGDGK